MEMTTLSQKADFFSVDMFAAGTDTTFIVLDWAMIELITNPKALEEAQAELQSQDYELIPFGAGRRVCPAITFGIASIEIALAQLLHSFHWELPPGVTPKDLDMTEVFGITMHRKVGLEVLAKPRFS
ncbi:hypothetical protein F8388_010869 [Cannabis sativa]|uniref:Cytochrome P450 n=1 Tax=Cannabis sativa TaxID=3483 RepID=A0A7J6DYT5_CANSA|nr:hypothetical protein F8388_010869 [Cannabis sativa]